MSAWRFIVGNSSYADFSVSVSPAVEKAVAQGESPPTVFLDIFDTDSITIGVNEDPEQVLDLEVCRANAIAVRRRVNGGGPIYAGAGSAFLVYFVPTSHPEVPSTTEETFSKVLTGVAELLERTYGFPARYRPLNDIEVEGRKLVPTSLKIEGGVMTLRIVINVKAIDAGLAARAMPMPPEKVRDKQLKDLESRYTWLEREAARAISPHDLEDLARACTAHCFGETDLERAEPSAVEQAYSAAFRETLETDAWFYGKSELTRLGPMLEAGVKIGRGRAKAIGGMIWATLAIRSGKVMHAIINGDWHPRPIDGVGWLEDSLIGTEAAPGAIRDRIEAFLHRPDIEFAGIAADDLTAACEIALAGLRPAT